MQLPAKRFLDLLESQQLLSDDIIAELRRQVRESKTKLSPELLAKLLVDNGHLTKFQASKLIAQVTEPASDVKSGSSSVDDDELGLATEDPQVASGPQVAMVFGDDEELVEADAVAPLIGQVEVVDSDIEVVEVVEPMEVVEATPARPRKAKGVDLSPSSTGASQRPTKKPIAKSNPWDSFRILGVGLALGLTLIAGFFLVNYFIRGSADELLEKADSNYETRSYETAGGLYKDFASRFPTHAKASYAKVRQALATLRRDAESVPDPKAGLETALQVLPPIASESGLPEQQSDLAGALVALAEKFISRADDRKETEERRALMVEMDRLMELINNPQYVGANQKAQQAPTLLKVQEDSERIKREINRDDSLTATLVKIDQKLDARDVLGAYADRRELVNAYPLLETAEPLVERVKRATAIQRELVTTSDVTWKISNEAASTEVGQSFVLGNVLGKPVPAMSGRVVFAKVKGSVYGLDGETGNVLWRKFVGQDFQSDPIRLGQSAAADALVCEHELGRLSRLDGKTGQVKWQASVGEPLHVPTVRSEDILVTSLAGNVSCLDAESGQAKWIKKLPQPIRVGPGASLDGKVVYVPAEHSNMYVLDRRDGTCQEVFYLGHQPGAISVPPMVLLGQLFVYQNNSSGSARVRIFSFSDQGIALSEAQLPIQVDGNIVVSPQIDGRRLIVLSDLGHMLALDVEPTVETQKVTTIASVPKNFSTPQLSWSLAEENKVWVSDNRFTRFDVQVSGQKFNRSWIKNDGDRFTAPSQKFDNVIIHSRTLRGNQGVRIAAVDADSGQPHWEIDLGSPVTMLVKSGDRKVEAVNSSGCYFALDNQRLRSSADANPAQGKPSMLFDTPVWLDAKSAVLMNRSNANQMAVFSDGTPKLKLLSANFGSAAPSCAPVAVNSNLIVGLDNGQLAMIDPTNGTSVGSPYQPTMSPGKKVRWNQPLYQADTQTLVIASDLLKLAKLSSGNGLRLLSDVDIQYPLVGPLAACGNQIVGVVSNPSSDTLKLYNANDLSETGSLELNSRLVAGPFSLASGCLIQTELSILSISADGKVAWTLDFNGGALLAAPVDTGGKWLMTTRTGEVLVVDPANGTLVGLSRVGQGLTSSPLIIGNNFLVGSDEGAVLALTAPTTVEAK